MSRVPMATNRKNALHPVDPAVSASASPQTFITLQPRTLVRRVKDALVASASAGLNSANWDGGGVHIIKAVF